VANELKRFMQGKGFVARWGGEEFLLVYEKGNMEDFLEHLEELRKIIQELCFAFDENKQITMSFGVAQDETLSGDELIKLADGRLYVAKETGRNRIVYKDE
jgi:diguanylate cyclase (GGDEF)-like protein